MLLKFTQLKQILLLKNIASEIGNRFIIQHYYTSTNIKLCITSVSRENTSQKFRGDEYKKYFYQR